MLRWVGMVLGVGWALSALAGAVLVMGTGQSEVPLILLMLVTSAVSVVAILAVRRRQRALGLPA